MLTSAVGPVRSKIAPILIGSPVAGVPPVPVPEVPVSGTVPLTGFVPLTGTVPLTGAVLPPAGAVLPPAGGVVPPAGAVVPPPPPHADKSSAKASNRLAIPNPRRSVSILATSAWTQHAVPGLGCASRHPTTICH